MKDQPQEVQLEIFRFLTRKDLTACCFTCRYFLHFVNGYFPPGWRIIQRVRSISLTGLGILFEGRETESSQLAGEAC